MEGVSGMPGVRKIEFLSEGFRDILTGPGVDAAVAAEARRQAARKEAETGEPYRVEKLASASSRAVYVVRPEQDEEGRVRDLDHETWMREVWPRVGGPKWRPR